MSRGGAKPTTRRRSRIGSRSKSKQHQQKPPLETEPSLIGRLDMWLSRLPGLYDSAGSQDNFFSSENSNEAPDEQIRIAGGIGMRRGEDGRLGGTRRKTRTRTTTAVAILSTLCATLLWVGAVSLSRGAQLTPGPGTNTSRTEVSYNMYVCLQAASFSCGQRLAEKLTHGSRDRLELLRTQPPGQRCLPARTAATNLLRIVNTLCLLLFLVARTNMAGENGELCEHGGVGPSVS